MSTSPIPFFTDEGSNDGFEVFGKPSNDGQSGKKDAQKDQTKSALLAAYSTEELFGNADSTHDDFFSSFSGGVQGTPAAAGTYAEPLKQQQQLQTVAGDSSQDYAASKNTVTPAAKVSSNAAPKSQVSAEATTYAAQYSYEATNAAADTYQYDYALPQNGVPVDASTSLNGNAKAESVVQGSNAAAYHQTGGNAGDIPFQQEANAAQYQVNDFWGQQSYTNNSTGNVNAQNDLYNASTSNYGEYSYSSQNSYEQNVSYANNQITGSYDYYQQAPATQQPVTNEVSAPSYAAPPSGPPVGPPVGVYKGSTKSRSNSSKKSSRVSLARSESAKSPKNEEVVSQPQDYAYQQQASYNQYTEYYGQTAATTASASYPVQAESSVPNSNTYAANSSYDYNTANSDYTYNQYANYGQSGETGTNYSYTQYNAQGAVENSSQNPYTAYGAAQVATTSTNSLGSSDHNASQVHKNAPPPSDSYANQGSVKSPTQGFNLSIVSASVPENNSSSAPKGFNDTYAKYGGGSQVSVGSNVSQSIELSEPVDLNEDEPKSNLEPAYEENQNVSGFQVDDEIHKIIERNSIPSTPLDKSQVDPKTRTYAPSADSPESKSSAYSAPLPQSKLDSPSKRAVRKSSLSSERFSYSASGNFDNSMHRPASVVSHGLIDDDRYSVSSMRSSDGKRCGSCRRVNEMDANFCSKCGAAFTENRATPIAPLRKEFMSPSPSSRSALSSYGNSYYNYGVENTTTYVEQRVNPVQTFEPPVPETQALHDPLKRAGCPIVTFGMGGKMVTMFPKKQSRFIPEKNSVVEQLSPGAVSIHSLTLNAKAQADMKIITSLKGPVEKCKKKEVSKLIQQVLEGKCEHKDFSNFKLTFQYFKVLIDSDGKTISSDVLQGFLATVFAGVNQEQSAFSVKEDSVDPNGSAEAYHKIRELVIAGKREEAVYLAKLNGLWSLALVISTHISKEVFNSTVLEYGNSVFSNSDPLHTVVRLFGNGFASSSGDLFQSTSDATSWKVHLKTILSNRTANDADAFFDLSLSLSKHGMDDEATLCFLLSGATLQGTEGKPYLLGPQFGSKKDGPLNMTAILITEIYEYLMRLNSNTFLIPHLQNEKLRLAYHLVEVGLVEEASKYCDSIATLIKTNSKPLSPQLTPRFYEDLKSLSETLSAAGVQATSKETFGWLSRTKIFDAIDKGITSIVEGPKEPVVDKRVSAVMSGTPVSSKTPPPVASQNQGSFSSKNSEPIVSNNYAAVGQQPYNNPYDSFGKDYSSYNGSDYYGSSYQYSATGTNNVAMNAQPSYSTGVKSPGSQQQSASYDYNTTNYSSSNFYDSYVNNSYQQSGYGDVNAGGSATQNYVQQQQPTAYNTPAQQQNYQAAEDDLGFGNNSLAPKNPAASVSTPNHGTPNQPQQDNSGQVNDDSRQTISKSSYLDLVKTYSTGISSFFTFRRTSSGATDQKDKATVANLGEENSFYYDKELKRWVNKKDPGSATETAAPPPGPPQGSRPPTAPPTTPNMSQNPSRTASPMHPPQEMNATQFNQPLGRSSTYRRSARSRYVDSFNPSANQPQNRPSLGPNTFVGPDDGTAPKIMPQRQ